MATLPGPWLQETKQPPVLLLLPRSFPLSGGLHDPCQLIERLSKPARKDPAFPITVLFVETGNVVNQPIRRILLRTVSASSARNHTCRTAAEDCPGIHARHI